MCIVCCPSSTCAFAALASEIESGDIILFDNAACASAISAICCCCCRSLRRRLTGCDVNNACCARSWRRAAVLVVSSTGAIFAFEFSLSKGDSDGGAAKTPRDNLTHQVVDVGFRLIPLLYLLNQSARRGAHVHALRRLYLDSTAAKKNFARNLLAQMQTIQADGLSITPLQLDSLLKQGGLPHATGPVRSGDRIFFAAANSGYLVFYLLKKMGLAVEVKNEKLYDVEDLLADGDIDRSMQRAAFGREIPFFYSIFNNEPPAISMV